MKKLLFIVLALSVFAVSSCGDQEGIEPDFTLIEGSYYGVDGNSGGGDQDPTGP